MGHNITGALLSECSWRWLVWPRTSGNHPIQSALTYLDELDLKFGANPPPKKMAGNLTWAVGKPFLPCPSAPLLRVLSHSGHLIFNRPTLVQCGWRPVLPSILDTWLSTVRWLTFSSSAISRLARPLLQTAQPSALSGSSVHRREPDFVPSLSPLTLLCLCWRMLV